MLFNASNPHFTDALAKSHVCYLCNTKKKIFKLKYNLSVQTNAQLVEADTREEID